MSFNGDSSFKRMRTDMNNYDNGPRRREPEKPNHILLLTVVNAAYPITIEVIESVCKLYGEVQRIVIFRKRGVQAMVEFRNIQTASRAKEGLQGADIYSGCCTLRVEFGKAEKLNVMRNGPDMWDFTVEDEQRNFSAPRPALLGDGPMESNSFRGGYDAGMGGGMRGGLENPMRGGGMRGGGMENMMRGGMTDRMTDRMDTSNRMYDGIGMSRGMEERMGGSGGMSRLAGRLSAPGYDSLDRFAMGGSGGLGGSGSLGGSGGMNMRDSGLGLDRYSGGTMGRSTGDFMGQQVSQNGPVLMVYGLNKDKMNADYLFNLFCLYGNVSKVKYLKTKEGCAMVEMGDGLSVERIITHLNNQAFFDSKMTLGYSKQDYLAEVQTPYELPDGSPSFKIFIGSKNNRFLRPDAVQKTRFLPPSKTLHFFNTPPSVEEAQINQVFLDLGVEAPNKITMLPARSEKSSRGQMEFSNLTDALEALVAANHAPISTDDNSRFPFIMKLAFSKSY